MFSVRTVWNQSLYCTADQDKISRDIIIFKPWLGRKLCIELKNDPHAANQASQNQNCTYKHQKQS